MKLITHPPIEDDICELTSRHYSQLPYVSPWDLPEDAYLVVLKYTTPYGSSLHVVWYGDFGLYRVTHEDPNFDIMIYALFIQHEREYKEEKRIATLH